MPRHHPRPTVKIKPSGYQPSKAEREELVKIDAMPEELADAALRPVRIKEDAEA